MEPEFANQGSAPARLEAGAAYAPARDYSGVALERLNQVNIELTNIFNDAGFQPIEPGMLQPAEPLFDLYGEEIWDRAFVVEDEARADGDGTLCLRPDFTVPVARAHLAAGGGTGRYGYFGPVFRRSPPGENQPLQHLQAGIEIIGSDDAAAADAEPLALRGAPRDLASPPARDALSPALPSSSPAEELAVLLTPLLETPSMGSAFRLSSSRAAPPRPG